MTVDDSKPDTSRVDDSVGTFHERQADLKRAPENEFPHLRRAGRYVFFAFCAAGCALLVAVLLKLGGVNTNWSGNIGSIAGMATFMALRDMSKPWATIASGQHMEGRDG